MRRQQIAEAVVGGIGAGDHTIDHRLFIGRVLRHEADGHAPAVFHQGRFTRLAAG